MKAFVKCAILVSLGVLCLGSPNGCPEPEPPEPQSSVLLNQDVSVPGGGGFGEATFQATSGQVITITMTAASGSMDPSGSLMFPDETSDYQPPLATASNGANTAQLTLDQTGAYTLTVFDGSNEGGVVNVQVELVQ